jgi:hypothetical protein
MATECGRCDLRQQHLPGPQVSLAQDQSLYKAALGRPRLGPQYLWITGPAIEPPTFKSDVLGVYLGKHQITPKGWIPVCSDKVCGQRVYCPEVDVSLFGVEDIFDVSPQPVSILLLAGFGWANACRQPGRSRTRNRLNWLSGLLW